MIGLFFLVINAAILRLSAKFVPGFSVTTWEAAFLGALALALIHVLFGFIGLQRKR